MAKLKRNFLRRGSPWLLWFGCQLWATGILVKIHTGFSNSSTAANPRLLLPPVPKQRFPRGLAKSNPFGAIIWGCSKQQIFYPATKLVCQKDLRKFWCFNWCNAPFLVGNFITETDMGCTTEKAFGGFFALENLNPKSSVCFLLSTNCNTEEISGLFRIAA